MTSWIVAKMKLYYSPGSTYARNVRIVAMETKLDKKMEMVNVAVGATAPSTIRASAQAPPASSVRLTAAPATAMSFRSAATGQAAAVAIVPPLIARSNCGI